MEFPKKKLCGIVSEEKNIFPQLKDSKKLLEKDII